MVWTRRQFLCGTTVLGAAVATGCATKVGGTPRPDPQAQVVPGTSSPAPAAEAVRIGVLSYQPYTIEEGGELTGPVPEVARAVLGQLGVTDIDFQVLDGEAVLQAALAAGQVDIVGGLAVRADLCAGLDFSVPDYVSGTALIVPKANPKGLATYADVKAKGAKVAVMDRLPEQTDVTKAGLAPANVVALPDPPTMIEAVRTGRVDCAAFDDLSSRELVKSSGGALTTAKPFMPPDRLPLVGAYAFPKESTELLESFNNRLRDLHESGDWLALVTPFGLGAEHAPPADLTSEKACAG
jgi:polar amino acid transport system substrate-binding protein